MDRPRFHSLARYLKRKLPCGDLVDVRVVSVPPRDLAGGNVAFSARRGRFRICIEKGASTNNAIGMLLHEFSHILAWELDLDDESGSWIACAQKTVWGWYLEWLGGA